MLKRAYNNAIHFVIRCELWIMKNLVGFGGKSRDTIVGARDTCFSPGGGAPVFRQESTARRRSTTYEGSYWHPFVITISALIGVTPSLEAPVQPGPPGI